jgi:hypothetical protein
MGQTSRHGVLGHDPEGGGDAHRRTGKGSGVVHEDRVLGAAEASQGGGTQAEGDGEHGGVAGVGHPRGALAVPPAREIVHEEQEGRQHRAFLREDRQQVERGSEDALAPPVGEPGGEGEARSQQLGASGHVGHRLHVHGCTAKRRLARIAVP